ncbi:MAG: CobD/CbiB family cobalamin biosynthesis protein [Cyanobacteriota bacterium]
MASPWLLVLLAGALDRWIGDPRRCPHPVQVMGVVIERLRSAAEAWAGDRPRPLRLAGTGITLVLVAGSLAAGWGVETLARMRPPLGLPLLLLGLASALAGGSLRQAVQQVLAALPDEALARQRLAWIVGRDVDHLDTAGMLRAAAETAAENAVDGLFAPLLWMLIGAALASHWPAAPGPLALAWTFKAASTLDSMLGYRRGRLRWLGTAGARLDDLLTWPAARLVALSLPLAASRAGQTLALWRQALVDGAGDPSPNAGVSQAAYAHAAGVRLGGANRYGGEWRSKPVLAAGQPPADQAGVMRILRLTDRLELIWLLVPLALSIPALAIQ